MSQQANHDKPLLTFCFNTEAQIWEQDMWNVRVFNRVHDVLAQRTNQIFPFPEITANDACFKKIQIAQNQLNADCCNPEGGPYAICGLYKQPIQPTDEYHIKPLFNTHYEMVYPTNQLTNIKDVTLESDLIFGVDTPWTADCLTLDQATNLEKCHSEANKQLYRQFHSGEINSSRYPNDDRTIFNNVTREIYNSIDNRNQYILYKPKGVPYQID